MADLEESEALSQLENLLAGGGAEDGQMPSRKDLLEMLESSELSDELKENLKELLSGGAPQLFGGYASGPYLGVLFAVLIFCVLIFFGYKLYKSIKDKELRREEKKKQKQMKKKK